MLGLSMSLPAQGVRRGDGFSPAQLAPFGWYSPTFAFQDTAGTLPATQHNDPVARLSDMSGNGRHLLQNTAAARPVLQRLAGMCWLQNPLNQGDGLALPNDANLMQVFTTARYETGVEASFSRFATMLTDSAGYMAATANRTIGGPNTAKLFLTSFHAGLNGGAHSLTVLPMPGSVVDVKRVTNDAWPVRNFFSRSSNDLARGWLGLFGQIILFDRILTAPERANLVAWMRRSQNI